MKENIWIPLIIVGILWTIIVFGFLIPLMFGFVFWTNPLYIAHDFFFGNTVISRIIKLITIGIISWGRIELGGK